MYLVSKHLFTSAATVKSKFDHIFPLIDAADQWWWTAALYLGVFTFSRLHLSKSPNAYIGTQSAIAYLVTLVGIGPPSTLEPPIDRLVGIIIGVSIMTVMVWALNPPKPPQPAPAASGS